MRTTIALADATQQTTTGDIWLFRGRSAADRAIRLFTNSPVNHVGMVIALDGLPPLLWHAELGSTVPDVWSGTATRGAQLHRLEDAVGVWVHKYGQRAWFRQLDATITRPMEDAALATVAEYDGRRFPRTGALVKRWLLGRIRRPVPLNDLYCAELVAITYERMGLLETRRPANWYDPGRFWSGDRMHLLGGSLGAEIEVVDVPRPSVLR